MCGARFEEKAVILHCFPLASIMIFKSWPPGVVFYVLCSLPGLFAGVQDMF